MSDGQQSIPVTSLATYMFCPRKLYLERVLSISALPSSAQVLGSIKHVTLDAFNRTENQIVNSITAQDTEKDILKKYRLEASHLLREKIINKSGDLKRIGVALADAFQKQWPGIAHECNFRAINVATFKQQTGLFGEELYEKLSPQIRSEVYIESESLKLKGVVDKIEIFPDKVVPYEIKSGTPPKDGVWPNQRVQIGAYILLITEKYKLPSSAGIIEFIETHEKRHVPNNPHLEREVKQIRDEVIHLLEGDDLPSFADNPKKCEKCPLQSQCYNSIIVSKKLREHLQNKYQRKATSQSK